MQLYPNLMADLGVSSLKAHTLTLLARTQEIILWFFRRGNGVISNLYIDFERKHVRECGQS